MSEPITLFICNCCGKLAHAVMQPVLVANRPPIIQVECLTKGCDNNYWTYSYREGGDRADNAQVLDRYTPVTMTQEQAERFVKAAGE